MIWRIKCLNFQCWRAEMAETIFFFVSLGVVFFLVDSDGWSSIGHPNICGSCTCFNTAQVIYYEPSNFEMKNDSDCDMRFSSEGSFGRWQGSSMTSILR